MGMSVGRLLDCTARWVEDDEAPGLALIPASIGAWTSRWFTVGGRIYYSLLAVTAPVLL